MMLMSAQLSVVQCCLLAVGACTVQHTGGMEGPVKLTPSTTAMWPLQGHCKVDVTLTHA